MQMKIHRRRDSKEIFKISEINQGIDVRHIDQKRKENYSFIVMSIEMKDGKERIFGHCVRKNKTIHIWPEHFESMYEYKTEKQIPSLWDYFLPKADQQAQSLTKIDSKKSKIRKSGRYIKRYESSGNPYRVEGLSRNISIKYESEIGEITDREIIIHSASYKTREDDVLYEAFCLLRLERRSFYNSRIISAHDPDTGEIIPDTWKWFIAQAEAAENAPVVLPKALEKALLAKPAMAGKESAHDPLNPSWAPQIPKRSTKTSALDVIAIVLAIPVMIFIGLAALAVALLAIGLVVGIIGGIIAVIF